MSEQEKIRASVERQFVESGEKDRLLQLLKERLTDFGWNDRLYAHCRETILNRKLENVTLDKLVNEASDYGRNTIHDSIKKEVLANIREFLDENLD
ncbi:transcription factor e(y)2-domain-containing protein [Phycomyces blakesleeanus]|uniref:Transcription and mRNA export factor SUS1 n=1 Tax=Phycomyces blakesleeanus TaxID=4837 RepID=A0ABR3AVK5_PHYBL